MLIYNDGFRGAVLRTAMPAANSSTMGQLRARRKAAKMLVVVVAMFAICYFPVHLLNILRYLSMQRIGIHGDIRLCSLRQVFRGAAA